MLTQVFKILGRKKKFVNTLSKRLHNDLSYDNEVQDLQVYVVL